MTALHPDIQAGLEETRTSGRAPDGHALRVQAWTDGACSGNPGSGGWGAVIRATRDGQVLRERELSGGEVETTNNRMELMAAIMTLEGLTRPTRITMSTDSEYVRNGILTWIGNWKRRGWQTSAGKPVKNVDLWQRLEAACARHVVD